MSNSIMNEMFPGEKIHKVDLHEGLSIGCIRYFLSFSHFTSKITYSTYIVYCTYNTYSFHFQNWTATNLLYFTILTRDMPWNGMLVKLNLRISSIISMNVRSRGHVLAYAHSVVQMGVWHFKAFRKLLAMRFLCVASFMQIKQAQLKIVHTIPFTVHEIMNFDYHYFTYITY